MPPEPKKTLPPLPPKEPDARPWRWLHDKPEGMWYLVNGPEGKENSVIPALHAFEDFGESVNAQLILRAVNQYDIVRELIVAVTRYTRVVEDHYHTLTDGQFGRFSDNPAGKELAAVIVKLLEIHESKG